MVLVCVSILLNGLWIEQNDEYRFKGSETKGKRLCTVNVVGVNCEAIIVHCNNSTFRAKACH